MYKWNHKFSLKETHEDNSLSLSVSKMLPRGPSCQITSWTWVTHFIHLGLRPLVLPGTEAFKQNPGKFRTEHVLLQEYMEILENVE